MKIFVQIAAYRDPQLIPTIKNMLENAKRPKNLRLAIARQFHPDDKFDELTEYENDSRFRILNIPHEESKGVCWARNLTQQLYDGEEYTLQIDSHMRFAPNWDDEMIKMIKQLQKKGYKKPLLTGYVSSFDPDNDPAGRMQEPWRMAFDRFIPEGAVFFLPETIPGWQQLKEPVTARFYSAHYCFTLGQFSNEVQHNPEYVTMKNIQVFCLKKELCNNIHWIKTIHLTHIILSQKKNGRKTSHLSTNIVLM